MVDVINGLVQKIKTLVMRTLDYVTPVRTDSDGNTNWTPYGDHRRSSGAILPLM